MNLDVVPVTYAEAARFVLEHHRHHLPKRGQKFAIAISDGERIRGVLIAARPASRFLDDGLTLEVARCCTDGVRNGCSKLYGAAWRAGRAMGFRRLISYTLPAEGGASMRAAGFHLVGETKSGGWSRRARPRVDVHPLQSKLRWELGGELGEKESEFFDNVT